MDLRASCINELYNIIEKHPYLLQKFKVLIINNSKSLLQKIKILIQKTQLLIIKNQNNKEFELYDFS